MLKLITQANLPFMILAGILILSVIIVGVIIHRANRWRKIPPLTSDQQKFIDDYQKEQYLMGVDPYEVEDDERLTKEEKEFIRQWDKEMN